MHPRLIELATAAVAAVALGLLAALAWSGAMRAALSWQGQCEIVATPPSSAIVGALVALAALVWFGRRGLADS